MTLREIFEKRRKAEEQARSLMSKENRTADDVKQADRWLDEAAEAEKEFDTQKRLDDIDAKSADEAANRKKEERKKETGELSEKDKLRRYMLTGEGGNMGWEAKTAATAQTVTTTGGGYTVPTETKARITTAMKAMGGMYANSNVLKTSGGNPINWPTLNDTAVSSEALAINTDNSTLTNTAFTFGQFSLSSFKYSSGQILIPYELLEDAIIDIDALIQEQLQNRLLRGLNALWTTGGGTTTIAGVVTGASYAAVASTQNDSITRENIVDLLHSVDPYYRRNAKFMFNDSTLKSIKKLAFGTSDDRPLWQPGMAFGEPPTIEGFPYIINQDVATIAAEAKSMLFGDFSRYFIREVGEWRMKCLTELYAMVDQISFVIFVRYDGKLDSTGTPVKYLLNALNT